jgi:hypothetical protein
MECVPIGKFAIANIAAPLVIAMQGLRIPDCLNYCGGLDFVK